MEFTACAFTGHRHINEEHKKPLPPLVLRGIEYAYSKGCRKFLAGGAIGFDTVAALEVIKFRISHADVSLILVLPCVNQSEKWNEAQKQRYEYILSSADEIIYINEEYTPTCMRERNRYLAENADILLAYVSRSSSGAAQTVRMAKGRCKEIYNLYTALEKQEKIP